MEKQHYRVLILGSGPAGLTAALYASRAELAPLVVDGLQPGGQLTITTEVENYPGFPEGILGPELMAKMRTQAERFGTTTIFDTATAVDRLEAAVPGDDRRARRGDRRHPDRRHRRLGQAARHPAETGAHGLRRLGVRHLRRVLLQGARVVVVGGGDTAMEEATFLTRFASKVTVVHRRGELRASRIMQERAKANPKIDFEWHSVVVDIQGTREKGITGGRAGGRAHQGAA